MQIVAGVIPLILSELYGFNFLTSAVYVNIIAFAVVAFIIVWILWQDIKEERLANPMPFSGIIGWAALGLVMAWGAEIVAALIVMYVLGIDPSSENTEMIVEISRLNPIFILIPAIIGPIMEELIFRKILFGVLYKKFNFIIAALISSFIFGIVHFELELIIVYMAMGFVFAFIYMKTKRIIVPIIVHMLLNSIAVIGQLLIDPEKLQQMQEQVMFIFF